MLIFYFDLIVFFVLNFSFKSIVLLGSFLHLNNISSLLVKLGLLQMEACSVKRVAGTCIELCLHLSVITFRYDILFSMQKQCYVVLRTITKSFEIQRSVILV
jgi:hypothetical protein